MFGPLSRRPSPHLLLFPKMVCHQSWLYWLRATAKPQKLNPWIPAPAPVTGTGTRTRHALPSSAAPWPSPPEAHLLIELENGPAINRQLAERLASTSPMPAAPGPLRRAGSSSPGSPPLRTGAARRRPSPGWGKGARELHRQMDETMAGPGPASPRRVRADLGGMRLGRSALSRPAASRAIASVPWRRPTTPYRRRGAHRLRRVRPHRRQGYGVADPNLDFSTGTCRGRSRYWVIEGRTAPFSAAAAPRWRRSGDLRAAEDVLPPRPARVGAGAAAGAAGPGRARAWVTCAATWRPRPCCGKPPRSTNPWASSTCRGRSAAPATTPADLHGA